MGYTNRWNGKVIANKALVLGNLAQNFNNYPGNVTFTPAASTTNVCLLTVQVVDFNGVNAVEPINLDLWLSDIASGYPYTSAVASGNIVAGTAGTVLSTYQTKASFRVQTNASGAFILSITDSAKTTYFPCAQTPAGNTVVGTRLVAGNYGA